jgi:hypothetical protein
MIIEKTCTKCKETKSVDLFYKRSDLPGKYASHCKSCKRAHDNQHYHKEEIKKAKAKYAKERRKKEDVQLREKEYKKEYNHRPEVKEAKRLFQQKRRLNKDFVAKEREREKLYAKQNPALFAYKTRLRKAAKLQRTPGWLTEDDYWLIKEAYDLAALRTKMFGFKWSVDHIIPLRGKTVSGLHIPSNLQVIPLSQNSSKGNRVSLL